MFILLVGAKVIRKIRKNFHILLIVNSSSKLYNASTTNIWHQTLAAREGGLFGEITNDTNQAVNRSN